MYIDKDFYIFIKLKNESVIVFVSVFVCVYVLNFQNESYHHTQNRNQKLKLIFLSQFVIFKIENLKPKLKSEIGISFFNLNRKIENKKRGWIFHPLCVKSKFIYRFTSSNALGSISSHQLPLSKV